MRETPGGLSVSPKGCSNEVESCTVFARSPFSSNQTSIELEETKQKQRPQSRALLHNLDSGEYGARLYERYLGSSPKLEVLPQRGARRRIPQL